MHKSPRVAVVDGDLAAARDLEVTLRQLGFEVCGSATRSAEALALAARAKPDLMLIDATLSGTPPGMEAAGRIQREFDVPVVYVTAHSDEALLARALSTLPYGYLEKPISPSVLHYTLLIALSRHSADRQSRDQIRQFLPEVEASAQRSSPDKEMDFATCLCTAQGCSRAEYADRVLLTALYRHALPVALLLWPCRRRWFAADYALIEQVGTFKCSDDLGLELDRLRTKSWVGGPTRWLFRLRVSSRRLGGLMMDTLDSATADKPDTAN
jgi:DNA-binding response OmpR family regulator